eukprot:GHVT01021011.1.p1 GENE.GHVT01021011.1~~GHVT01021011.1.p1  ORF type:complete len:143 (-),score=3.42 GHVT01021011.1:538-966(-)
MPFADKLSLNIKPTTRTQANAPFRYVHPKKHSQKVFRRVHAEIYDCPRSIFLKAKVQDKLKGRFAQHSFDRSTMIVLAVLYCFAFLFYCPFCSLISIIQRAFLPQRRHASSTLSYNHQRRGDMPFLVVATDGTELMQSSSIG